jgi:putative transposase
MFYSAADLDLLDSITAEILSRFAARLHAYCWMTDHIHLLIQVSDAPLGKLMLHIAGGYAREAIRAPADPFEAILYTSIWGVVG